MRVSAGCVCRWSAVGSFKKNLASVVAGEKGGGDGGSFVRKAK